MAPNRNETLRMERAVRATSAVEVETTQLGFLGERGAKLHIEISRVGYSISCVECGVRGNFGLTG